LDNVEYITQILKKFIDTFKIKYKYCNIGILKKLRIDSRKNLEYDEEKWCNLFLKKSYLNYCAKIILLKVFEDSGKITCKINQNGINKWNMLVKNIKERYDKLYDLAIIDIKNEDEYNWIAEVFSESDYDIYEIDKELATIIVDDLSKISFSNLTEADIGAIFRIIYPLDDREESKLQEFYQKAPALDYILSLN